MKRFTDVSADTVRDTVATAHQHFIESTVRDYIALLVERRAFAAEDPQGLAGFAEIGKRFGPFDLTLLPIGAYDPLWPDVHTNPEEAVAIHAMIAKPGAPLVPGSDGPVPDAASARAFAEEHGLPIAIKAAFGGGGRGIKVVREMADVEDAFEAATREAVAAFGRGECFVERFLDRPRHVEAQVLADEHGHVAVLGTRDCSLQRRNQKLVEEAPAPFLTDEQRERIHTSAREICRAAGYTGAGTVEYLVAPDGLISFLEVNTRLQVEHPVTEEVFGVDLVREQFRVAAGEPLSIPEDPTPRGHALEFRLNAEDPAYGFLPVPGPIDAFEAPTGPGVRMDSGVRTGSVVPGEYDSLLAKLIVWGEDRAQAIARARDALAELRIDGVPTVVPFHRAVLEQDAFTSGDRLGVYTTWIESEFAEPLAESPYLGAEVPPAVAPPSPSSWTAVPCAWACPPTCTPPCWAAGERAPRPARPRPTSPPRRTGSPTRWPPWSR